jgi:hypothetical protein
MSVWKSQKIFSRLHFEIIYFNSQVTNNFVLAAIVIHYSYYKGQSKRSSFSENNYVQLVFWNYHTKTYFQKRDRDSLTSYTKQPST